MFRTLILGLGLVVGAAKVWADLVPEPLQAEAPPAMHRSLIHVNEVFGRITQRIVGLGAGVSRVSPESRWAGGTVGAVAGRPLLPPDLSPLASAEDVRAGRVSSTLFLGLNRPHTDFSDAQLSGLFFDGANLAGSHFAHTQMTGASARVASFSGAVFHKTRLDETTLEGARFDGAVLSDVTLTRARLTASSFARTITLDGIARGAKFEDADLSGARFRGTDLTAAVFDGATLTGAVFSGTLLGQSSWDGADISGVDMMYTEGLTEGALDGACGDGQTKLPEGLSVPPCRTRALAGIPAGPVQLADLRATATPG